MKNIKTIFSKLFVLALAGAFFAGCSNSFDVSEGATGDAAQPAGHVRVLLASEVARTILPSAWDETHKKGLTYYLTGTGTLTDATGSTKTYASADPLDYDKITGSGQEIELSPGTWTLTLSAYQLADSGAGATPSASNMVLSATNTGIDLTTAGSTEAFKLKPVSSTQATGSVSITGSVKGGTFLKYIVQDIGTIAPTTGAFTSADAGGAYKVTSDELTVAAGASVDFSYSKNVKAGSNYYYMVEFFNGNPASGGQSLGRYLEALIVDGGNVSSKTLALGDFLNSPADNPTTLDVDTLFTSVGQAANADVPNTFEAKFTWDDNSGNETGFELKIYKGTLNEGTTTYPTTATYTIKKGAITIGTGAGQVKTNSNADGTADPTMGKGETTCTVFLETGYTYKASIRAYNRYDETDATDTPTTITEVNAVTGTDMPFGMFTVAYTLGDSNAFVKTGSAATDKDENEMYVVGYNYKTTTQTLLGYVKASGTSASYPYVTAAADTLKFVKWIETVAGQTSDEMDAATAVTNIAANNIANKTLTGVWKSVANVSVVFPNYAALASSKWIKSYKVGSAAAVDVTSNELVDVSATTGDTIVFTYDENLVSDVTAFAMGGSTFATVAVDATAHTVTFNTSGLTNAEGHWIVTISGLGSYDDGGDTESRSVSQSFNINLN